jgi:hypothetical protein
MLFIKTKNNLTMLYGTIKECVDTIWDMIDFDNMVFPDFDYAVEKTDGLTRSEIYNKENDAAFSWYGCKDLKEHFCANTISLMFGYYSGGCLQCLELTGKYASEKQELIECIISTTYGYLEEDDMILVEIR